MLIKLGFSNKQKNFIRQRVSKLALRSSFFIWSNRFNSSWQPPILVKRPTTCKFPPKNNLSYPLQPKPVPTVNSAPLQASFRPLPLPPPASSSPTTTTSTTCTSTTTHTTTRSPLPSKSATSTTTCTTTTTHKNLTAPPSYIPAPLPLSSPLSPSPSLSGIFKCISASISNTRLPTIPSVQAPSSPPYQNQVVEVMPPLTLANWSKAKSNPDWRKCPPVYINLNTAWIMDPNVVFFPESDKLLVPLHWDGQYFKGLLSAYCSISKNWLTFLSFDHGAYPWGRSPLRGALAALCRLVGINTKSGTFNCCIICHLLVANLEMDFFSINDLYTYHLPLLKKYLVSKIKRDYDDVIIDVLDSLN